MQRHPHYPKAPQRAIHKKHRNLSENQTSHVLLELVQGDEGKKWAAQRTSGWDAPANDQELCTKWEGVTCDNDYHPISIDLSGTNLTGRLPPSLGLLHDLRKIVLQENNLEGFIPSDLFLNLPALEQIDLSWNQLTGEIPTLEYNGKLKYLDVSNNRLGGKLMDNLGKWLPNMVFFDLRNNTIAGTLPSSVGEMGQLKVIDFSNNSFVGSIPPSLGNLKNMTGLFLSHNRLVGTIPTSLTDESLRLEQVFINSNYLSGTLPTRLADLKFLKNLFVDGNRFTGIISQDICVKNLNKLFFSRDQINADKKDFKNITIGNNTIGADVSMKVSDSSNVRENSKSADNYRLLSNTTFDTLEQNGCNSIACPVGSYSTRKTNDGMYPCEACPKDTVSYFLGESICHTTDPHLILNTLYNATNGPGWTNVNNWRDTTKTVCEREGITCADNHNVIGINLTNKNLTGTIPEDLIYLSHLKVLDLSDNGLKGYIPDLWILPLENLDLSGNHLTGQVPLKLCNKEGINGNGENGITSCDYITCSLGTYSHLGRADTSGPCKVCETSEHLGSKTCILYPEVTPNTLFKTFGIIFFCGLVVGVAVFFAGRAFFRRDDIPHDDDESILVDLNAEDKEEKLWGSLPSKHSDDARSVEDKTELSTGTGRESFAVDMTLKETEPEKPKEKEPDKDLLWLDVPKIT